MNLARMIDCLDHDLCDQIVNSNWNFNPAKVIKRDGTVVDPIRSNTACTITGELNALVHLFLNHAVTRWSKQIQAEYPQHITQCFHLPGVSPDFETWCEHVGILKYEKSQEYNWHVDQTVEKRDSGESYPETRLLSIVVYLNDDFKGGETEMFGRKYRPEKGKALIFPSTWLYPHRSCPVIEGTKYALVTWYHPSN